MHRRALPKQRIALLDSRFMAASAPAETRITAERYFRLVDEGVLRPDDRVELLEGSSFPWRTIHRMPRC